MNTIFSNVCECYESYEDIDHIVFKWSRFKRPREQFFDNIIRLGFDIPVSVCDILVNKYLPILKILYKYLYEISYHV